MEIWASPVLSKPTNSLARLMMLPTQGMRVGEAINLGMASSCKTNCTFSWRGATGNSVRKLYLAVHPGIFGQRFFHFFLAGVQTGVGPFLAIYLAGYGWNEQRVGLALTVGGIAR